MRVFAASFATETNTFSPIPTSRANFEESFFAPPGTHPDRPTLCSAPIWVARRRAKAEGFTLIEGTAAWSEPSGTLARADYETIRDQILSELEQAMPVDAVLLGLHGAMVAHGYDDCEGDIVERVRMIVGAKTPIGVELDPHNHMTVKRVENADIIICFKEFPHIDFVERAEELVTLTLAAARGEIRPRMSLYDCRQISSYPTTREPMRGFVDKTSALEGENGVLSVSLVHGFPYADVAEIGSRVLVVTDDRKADGDRLARELGEEFIALRGRTMPPFMTADEAIDHALAADGGTFVLADPCDNPGGGAPADSTVLLRRLLDRGVENAALAPIWDPVAVRFCFAAGEGSTFPLRFGGKVAPGCGDPLDAQVSVTKLVRDAWQSFQGSRWTLGDAAAIRIGGVDVVLITVRTQAFGTDLFSNLGIDPTTRRIVSVKSTNHFHAAYAPIAREVLYVDTEGILPRDMTKVPFTKAPRPFWPLDEDAPGRLVL